MLRAVIIFSFCTCVTAMIVAKAMEPPIAAKIVRVDTKGL